MYVNDDSKRDTGDGRSSEIVRSGKVPVIAPDGAFLSEESFPLPGGAGEATGSKAPLLPSLLRFKGLILTIFVVVAVPSIAAIWVLVAPEYKARAEIRVSPIRPKFVFPTEENGMIPLYESYKNTQVAVILSPTVLQRALEEEEVQTTKWLRDPPKSLSQWLGGQAETSMERLRAAITVSPRRQSEIIDISFSAQDGKEAADVVNAIVDHYMVDVAEKTDETHDILYRKLTAQHQILRDGISTHEKFLAGLRKELGTGLPDELIAKRRVRLDETQAHLDEIRRKVSVLEMHKRELRSGAISTQQMERIEYIQVVSGMNAEQRGQLRDRLAAHLQMRQDQMSRDEADLRELTDTLAKDPNDQAVQRNRKLEETKVRIEIVQRKVEDVEWRIQELDKVGQGPVEEEAAPTEQLWVRPEYHSDPEWGRLNLAVKTVRHQKQAEGKLYKDSHPKIVALAQDLQFAEELLREREGQLDQLSRTSPGASRSVAETAGPTQPAGGDFAKAKFDYEEQLKLAERELEQLKHESALLSERAEEEKREFEEDFRKAQLMDQENRSVLHKRQLFQAVQERLDHKEMERNVPASIKVNMRAFAPTVASGDRRAVYTVMALVGALGLGVGAAFLKMNANQAIYAAEHLPTALRMPFLGQLPLLRKKRSPGLEDDPRVAESVRMIRTALFSRIDGRGSAVLISSADVGAGKSTVATMLAKSLADSGKEVLLIDADLRQPSISGRFSLEDEPGFIESLSGRIDYDQGIFPTDTPRLAVMPAGIRGNGADLELTANGAFSSCMKRLRCQYDIILLDSTPILPVADARIISRQVDGTILVVREDKCRRGDVIDALACLDSSGGKLLGTVFIGSAGRGSYGGDYNYGYGNGNGNGNGNGHGHR